MAFVIQSKFPRTVRRVRRMSNSMDELGKQAVFYGRAIGSMPKALVHYRTETIRLIAEISMGTGALAVIGGTVVIVGFLTLFTGGTIAVQGYSSLGNIGVEALTGFFAAFINVRIAAPVISGIGLAATIGAGSTAQLGAMRVAEEIDALESMGIRPVPYLVGTRVLAGMIAIIPLYSLAVIASFVASRFATVVIYGQSMRRLRPLLLHLLDPERHPVVVRAGDLDGGRGDDDPHLLRLPRRGRSGGRRCRGG